MVTDGGRGVMWGSISHQALSCAKLQAVSYPHSHGDPALCARKLEAGLWVQPAGVLAWSEPPLGIIGVEGTIQSCSVG